MVPSRGPPASGFSMNDGAELVLSQCQGTGWWADGISGRTITSRRYAGDGSLEDRPSLRSLRPPEFWTLNGRLTLWLNTMMRAVLERTCLVDRSIHSCRSKGLRTTAPCCGREVRAPSGDHGA